MTAAYSALFILGALASLIWLSVTESQQSAQASIPSAGSASPRQFEAGLLALAAGLLGARISFVLLHGEYYSSKPIEILWFWQGGLTWVGGVIGVIIALGIFAAAAQRSFWRLADALALPGAIMAVATWSGCLLEGCAYGRLTGAGSWAPAARNMFCWSAPRWPTQSIGVIASAAILIGLYWFRSRDYRPGTLAGLSLSAIAAVALSLSFTRGDPVLLFANIRIDAIGAAAVLALAFGTLAFRTLRR